MGKGEKKKNICMNIKSSLAELCLNSQGEKSNLENLWCFSHVLCNYIYNNIWVESWQSLNCFCRVSEELFLSTSTKKLNIICSTVCILLLFYCTKTFNVYIDMYTHEYVCMHSDMYSVYKTLIWILILMWTVLLKIFTLKQCYEQ